MFKRVIVPLFLSLIILSPLFIYIFWYFNGLLTYLATGDGREQGVLFLIQNVASVDDPSTNGYDALDKIIETLPKHGLEVASVVNLAKSLKEFISVKVVEVYKHPDAEKLNICEVFDGKNTFNVVCGAPNVKLGMIGVFANIGTFIPGLDLILKKSKIRGEESIGMLCSSKALITPT